MPENTSDFASPVGPQPNRDADEKSTPQGPAGLASSPSGGTGSSAVNPPTGKSVGRVDKQGSPPEGDEAARKEGAPPQGGAIPGAAPQGATVDSAAKAKEEGEGNKAPPAQRAENTGTTGSQPAPGPVSTPQEATGTGANQPGGTPQSSGSGEAAPQVKAAQAAVGEKAAPPPAPGQASPASAAGNPAATPPPSAAAPAAAPAPGNAPATSAPSTTAPASAAPAPPAAPKPQVPFSPVLLQHIREEGSHTLAHYQKRGGYETARSLLGTDPAALLKTVDDSGLRGRGGAGFPTGKKWSFLAKGTGKPVYLAVNGDESEPGTFKDRHLLEKDPHQLLEGVILTCYAIGSHHAFIYLRGEFILGYERLHAAVQEAKKAGFIGPNAFGKSFDLKVTVVRGGGAYICGEETGMLSSIEGGRGYPKVKPPFPAVSGLFKCPTIVNNVETICSVVHILKNGAYWFRQWGTEKSAGFKIFCLSGSVKRPGVYEVPLGIPMLEFIEKYGGGLRDGVKMRAVIPGGLSAPLIPAEKVKDVTLDYESLAGMGSMLGSGGITVLDDTVDLVSAIYNTMRFYHHESCGQCTPCREGTGWLEKLAHRFHHHEGRPGEVDLLNDICKNMRGRTICVLADAAAMPMQSYLQLFRQEFETRITEPAWKERQRSFRDEMTPNAKEKAKSKA